MFWLIPILVFLAVGAIGATVVMAVGGTRRKLRQRLELEKAPAASAEEASAANKAVGRIAGGLGKVVSSGKASRNLREELARAGYHADSAASVFIGVKMILGFGGIVGGFALALWLEQPLAVEIFLGMLPPAVCFFGPNWFIRKRMKARKEEMRDHLPDVVDLVEICVSGGMGLDAAWQAVKDEMRTVSTVVADEMALTQLEIQLGAPRTIALRHMADRTGAEELGSLVGMLVQSDKFGTSVGEALRTFANSMREARSASAEEQAEKTAVKLLFPMVLFIFPAMMIILGGPAMLTLRTMMTK